MSSPRRDAAGIRAEVEGKEFPMRRLLTLPVALAGLAMAWPAPSALAGLDSVCSTCNGQPRSKARPRPAHAHKHADGHTLCASCAAKAQAAMAASPPAMAASGCSACDAAALAAAPAGTAMTMPMPSASAPGFASVGGASPSPSSPILLAGETSGAPGYATVGGTIGSTEPAPVGVMRTNYSPQTPGTLGASVDSSHGGPAMGMGNVPFARPEEVPPSLYAPQRPRRSLVSRLLLPDFSRRRAEADTRIRERHAMVSYGAQNGPSELPAAMVYGGK